MLICKNHFKSHLPISPLSGEPSIRLRKHRFGL